MTRLNWERASREYRTAQAYDYSAAMDAMAFEVARADAAERLSARRGRATAKKQRGSTPKTTRRNAAVPSANKLVESRSGPSRRSTEKGERIVLGTSASVVTGPGWILPLRVASARHLVKCIRRRRPVSPAILTELEYCYEFLPEHLRRRDVIAIRVPGDDHGQLYHAAAAGGAVGRAAQIVDDLDKFVRGLGR